MKTFFEYLALYEDAPSFIAEKKPDQGTEDANNMAIAVMALKHMLKTRPELVISFLNLHRMEPDIREILNKHNLDSFVDIRKKMNNGFTDKGLGDRSGSEGGEEIKPPVADGFNLG